MVRVARATRKPLFHFSQKSRKKSPKVGPGPPKIDPKSTKIDQKSLPEGLGRPPRPKSEERRATGDVQRAPGASQVAISPTSIPKGPPKSPWPSTRILEQIYIYYQILLLILLITLVEPSVWGVESGAADVRSGRNFGEMEGLTNRTVL